MEPPITVRAHIALDRCADMLRVGRCFAQAAFSGIRSSAGMGAVLAQGAGLSNPFTPTNPLVGLSYLKRWMAEAVEAAAARRDRFVGTEHLLLAYIRIAAPDAATRDRVEVDVCAEFDKL